MVDLTQTTIARSDILNADDLVGKSITIKVTKVSLCAGEQPIAIHYENDGGKPFMPCKTVRRLLVHIWGCDGNQYVGRSLTLYRDDSVTFGGMAVGGVRISHASHIDKPVTVALSASKKSKKPFTVKPLVVTAATVKPNTELLDMAYGAASNGTKAFNDYLATLTDDQKAEIRPQGKALMAAAKDADDAEKGETSEG